jgi:hypothetical protein
MENVLCKMYFSSISKISTFYIFLPIAGFIIHSIKRWQWKMSDVECGKPLSRYRFFNFNLNVPQ